MACRLDSSQVGEPLGNRPDFRSDELSQLSAARRGKVYPVTIVVHGEIPSKLHCRIAGALPKTHCVLVALIFANLFVRFQLKAEIRAGTAYKHERSWN